jgi:RNA polymerase sigma-70 factor (ECF subfamily)
MRIAASSFRLRQFDLFKANDAARGTAPVAQRPILQKAERGKGGVRQSVLPDLELVEKVKAGNAEAFGELVVKYQDRVFNTCWRICGNLEDARDLTQEAFLKVFRGLSAFRQESGFYTWLFRVAVNLALSQRRRVKTRREVPLPDAAGEHSSQAQHLSRKMSPSSGHDPSQSAVHAELMSQVVRAVQLLEESDRAVIVLRDIEGFDYHEIGQVLEIPPGTVRSRLHRARTELRRLMGTMSQKGG